MSTNRVPGTQRPPIRSPATRFLRLAMGVALLVIAFDALTKWVIGRELGPGGSRSAIQIAGSFFELRYTENGGIAFGLFDGRATLAGILVGVVIVPLVVVLIVLASRGPHWAVASGLVLGGAAGNLIDRLGDQTVTDFISVGRWPSFNISDAAITVGALILIFLSLREQGTIDVEAGTDSR